MSRCLYEEATKRSPRSEFALVLVLMQTAIHFQDARPRDKTATQKSRREGKRPGPSDRQASLRSLQASLRSAFRVHTLLCSLLAVARPLSNGGRPFNGSRRGFRGACSFAWPCARLPLRFDRLLFYGVGEVMPEGLHTMPGWARTVRAATGPKGATTAGARKSTQEEEKRDWAGNKEAKRWKRGKRERKVWKRKRREQKIQGHRGGAFLEPRLGKRCVSGLRVAMDVQPSRSKARSGVAVVNIHEAKGFSRKPAAEGKKNTVRETSERTRAKKQEGEGAGIGNERQAPRLLFPFHRPLSSFVAISVPHSLPLALSLGLFPPR